LLSTGHKESWLDTAAQAGDKTAEVVRNLLRRCNTFQFHDTSESSKIRAAGYVEDAKYLRADAGNLAAYLHSMRKTQQPYYDRIVQTIRQVCPQFKDFVLEPSELNDKYILLNWMEKHQSGYLMGPHQLSDGTLRFMALATLFLQHPDRLPRVIVIDEPELGLHPQAIAVLAGLIKSVSQNAQVIVATQSVRFVDYFELSDIRPIEHRGGVSQVLDLRADEFSEWLEDYSTGELWEKNVFGGGPRYE
jgi:predicted ATPase